MILILVMLVILHAQHPNTSLYLRADVWILLPLFPLFTEDAPAVEVRVVSLFNDLNECMQLNAQHAATKTHWGHKNTHEGRRAANRTHLLWDVGLPYAGDPKGLLNRILLYFL